jgi:pyruvate/2-oxoglutarate dehydrogenase complex dihydrolipoamide acyltransferase (E2) component
MAAITVKRKPKIGFREEAAPEEAAEAAPEVAQAPVLARYDNVSDGSSYMLAGICGLVAMFIFLALLFIQYTEQTYYQDAFIQNGANMSAPSTTPSAPVARAPEPAVAAPAATPSESAPAAAAPAPSKDDGGNMRSKVDNRNAAVDAAVENK